MKESRSRLRPLLGLAAAAVLVAVVGIAAFLLRGGGPLGASLQLVALGADGVFGSDVVLAPSGDTAFAGFPLVLGAVNEGLRPGRPRELRLAMPAWVRLVDERGRALPSERTEGNPLAFVRLEFAEETVEPGTLPLVPAGLERLRILPVISPIDCRIEWNGVPAFQPAPPWDPARLSDVSIYWAFDDLDGAQAGLLRTRLPEGAVRPSEVRMEFGAAEVFPGMAPWPSVVGLASVSAGEVGCGEPERPVRLTVLAWDVEGGGHLIIVGHDRRSRLVLFDLDADDRVELEIQDTNADGVFETRRGVSYPVPAFLVPTG